MYRGCGACYHVHDDAPQSSREQIEMPGKKRPTDKPSDAAAAQRTDGHRPTRSTGGGEARIMTAAEPRKQSPKPAGGDLFIVDNSDADWKVRRYLRDWCQLSERIDIATGYFEIGSLLALDSEWQKVDQIRLLMGDEVSFRTRKAFEQGLRRTTSRLDQSIEAEKEKNDFLKGVPAIVEAIREGKITCRVYRKDKFHAKAYITHARLEVVGSTALVGSSNFTFPGLTENIELNVQITGRPVNALQEWYDRHWEQAEDVTPEILRTIERHILEYTPFDVYAKSLQEFFRGHEITADEWERLDPEQGGSRMIPVLDQYQIEGYRTLMKIARQYRGAFLCDGVGLGKTFIGLMLIERLAIKESKRVALFAPKGTLESVWKPALHHYLRYVGGTGGGDFSNLVLFSHTDLGREGEFTERFQRIKELAHTVIIDEAHHFRNPGALGAEPVDQEATRDTRGRLLVGERRRKPSRYRLMYDLLEGSSGPKNVFLLTATPINNKLADFRHMVDLFARREDHYFDDRLGIHSLRGHFTRMERQLKRIFQGRDEEEVDIDTSFAEAAHVLVDDSLFRGLVVQRSRSYAKESQLQHGASTSSFPTREPPRVANYSIRKTYGKLLEMVEKAFHKDLPLFRLAIYYPLHYYIGDDETIDPFEQNRQQQVVGLIRTQFLKRFESSTWAFERSCERLMLKLLTWVTRHSETDLEKNLLDRWRRQNSDLIDYVQRHQLELFGDPDEDPEEDIITDEMLDTVEYLPRDEYDVPTILSETLLDLNEIVEFIKELKKFKPQQDDKLKAFVELLKTDPVLKKYKVLVFTEFADTARYLRRQLEENDIQSVAEIDSGSKANRLSIIKRFSPYYNQSSSEEAEAIGGETRVLISTDILSEGLNLQDCTRLINYDIHWNPVRLMQRIGRVDRRMNPEVEEKLLADHPDQKNIRGRIVYWNFLPPDEINELLTLYTRVTHKTLRISKTMGIEGRKLLTPEDEYDALREFNESYEGSTTPVEQMHLEFQQLLRDDADLENRLNNLPGRVFSGKEHLRPGTRAVFFCYTIPRPDYGVEVAVDEGPPWTEEAGETKWYLYHLQDDSIIEEPAEIVDLIRSTPETPRHCEIEQATLSDIRKKIDKHIKNTVLKQLQAPVGVKAKLKCWMELN